MKPFLIILVAIGTSQVLASPRYTRTVGGQPALPGQFPFIVSLNNPGQFCDASIIHKNWVLTAAHCVADVTPSTVVLVGTNKEHTGGQKFNITHWKSHEDFEPDTLRNDIGLIRIDGEFSFGDLVQPVRFGDAGVNSGCLAAGWGVTEYEDYPEDLMFVELTALSLEECRDFVFSEDLYLGPEQVCALGHEGKGSCYGDSGGPLVVDGKLAGVVSYGIMPCAHGFPSVYTRPAAYADWINRQILE